MKEGWTYKKLEEVCEVFCDGDWIESKNQSADGIRLIQTGNVGNGVYKDKADKSKYISEKTFKELNCTEIFAGDILVSRLPDPIGRACVVPKSDSRMITAVDCTIIKVKDYLNSKFFVYYTQSKEYSRYIEKYTTGATRKRISRSNLGLIKVPFPSLIKQQQIVSELDLLSDVIEKKKAQIEELDKLAQSLFYDMFGDPVINEKGWIIRKLGEICDVRDGTHDSPSYLLSSDYVLITSKNIQGDSIDFSTANFISKEDYDNINKRSYVDDGDIIMAMIGTIGKPIIVKRNDINFCIKNVALIKFCDKDEVLNIYIKGLLDNESYISYIQGLNKGGTQKFVALGTLRGLRVPLSPLALQQEYAAKIEVIEQMKAKVRQSLKETEELFNSRMDYYFN